MGQRGGFFRRIGNALANAARRAFGGPAQRPPPYEPPPPGIIGGEPEPLPPPPVEPIPRPPQLPPYPPPDEEYRQERLFPIPEEEEEGEHPPPQELITLYDNENVPIQQTFDTWYDAAFRPWEYVLSRYNMSPLDIMLQLDQRGLITELDWRRWREEHQS